MFIGIDGGGSRTVAVLVDEAGNERVRIEGGPGRVDIRAPHEAATLLIELARQAAQQAQAGVTAICCGLAGAGREPERTIVENALRAAGIAAVATVVTDAEAAMRDAFGTGSGILLIAGTGSIAWGRGEDGRVARTGGWGHLLGDEGSGYAIGIGALRAVLRAHDGRGAPTSLEARLLGAIGLAAPELLVHFVANAGKADIAAFAPLVFAEAVHDSVALGIIEEAARALAAHVAALYTRLRPWSATVPFALSGGLIAADRPLRPFVLDALEDWDLDLTLQEADVDPARGAAALAREYARA